MQQSPQNPAHKQERDEHCGEREGHGQDGEANLCRPPERCLQGPLPHFHMPDDIFQHHDGVIHDEPHT